MDALELSHVRHALLDEPRLDAKRHKPFDRVFELVDGSEIKMVEMAGGHSRSAVVQAVRASIQEWVKGRTCG
jgi:hypothetical protein